MTIVKKQKQSNKQTNKDTTNRVTFVEEVANYTPVQKMRAHVFLFSEIIFEETMKATLRSKQTLRSNERRRQKITCSKRTNEMALLIYPEEASLTGQFCFCIVVFNPLLK